MSAQKLSKCFTIIGNKMDLNWTKYIIFILLLLLIPQSFFAQVDTRFWFVAPDVTAGHGTNGGRPIFLRFTTLNVASSVIISQPANPSFTPVQFNMAANSNYSVDLTTFIDAIENTPPNTVLNKGLLIVATAPLSVYYEVNNENNADIFALKGSNALGKLFYVSAQTVLPYDNRWGYNPAPLRSFEVVATEDNTTIKITPSAPIVGRAANTEFTIILNKGQTYSATINPAFLTTIQFLDGSKIVSDKPVAVTISNDSQYHTDPFNPSSGAFDLMGDQTVPVNILGTEYIVMKGKLYEEEYVFILATANNTNVTVNGVSQGNLQEGKTYAYRITSSATYIKTNQPAYVYHMAGFGAEVGGAILPSIDKCTGSFQVGFVRSIITAPAKEFWLNLMVRADIEPDAQNYFELTVDGVTIPNAINGANFIQIPNSIWKAASINLSSVVSENRPCLITNSKDIFHMGLINGSNGASCRYGYFSAFNTTKASIISADGDTSSVKYKCVGEETQLIASGGLRYEWFPSKYLDDAKSATPIVKFTEDDSITYTVYVYGTCKAIDSAKVTIRGYGAPLAQDKIACLGQSIPSLIAEGAGIKWYRDIDLTDLAYTGSIFNTGNTSVGTYTYYATQTRNCVTPAKTVTLTIRNNPVAEAGIDPSPLTCTSRTVQLDGSGSATGTNISYLWTGTQIQAGQNSLTPIAAGPGKYIITVTNNSTGCFAMDSVVVNQTLTTVNSGSALALTICAGEMVNLDDMVAGRLSGGYWAEFISGNIISNQLNSQSIQSGVNKYIYNIDSVGVCNGDTTVVSLTVNARKSAGLSSLKTICNNDSWDLLNSISGQDPAGIWKDYNKTGRLSGTIFNGNGAASGIYQFRYVVAGDAVCPGDSVVIAVEVAASFTAGVAVPISLCNDTSFNLYQALANASKGGVWSELTSSGALEDSIFLSNGLKGGTYQFLYTLIGTGTCSGDTTNVYVQVREKKISGIPQAGLACGVGSYNLFSSLLSYSSGGIWVDEMATGRLTDYIFNLDNLAQGNYTFRYVFRDNEVCEGDSSRITVSVISSKTAGVAIASIDNICPINSIDLYDYIKDYDLGGSWKDENNTGKLQGSILNPKGLRGGTYKFTYSFPISNNCPASSATVSIRTDTEKPVIICKESVVLPFVAGADFYEVKGSELNPDTLYDVCGAYTLSNSLNSDDVLIGEKVYATTKSIIWTVTDYALNSASCKIIINILDIPNLFTPNADGHNDTWDFVIADKFPDARIELYDRWGNFIHTLQGSNISWDGIVGGDEVPQGTYRYVILQRGVFIMNGFVTIIR